MRALPIRFVQILALAAIGVGTLTDPSFAEKQSPQAVKQFCATAGGVFFIESNGTYSCSYPTVRGITTYKNCTAGGDCEYVDYCGGVICGRTPVAGSGGGKGRRPKEPFKARRSNNGDRRDG